VVTRLNFERGGSVGVLLYDPQDDTVVLVRQFRYPVYAGLDQEARRGMARSKRGCWRSSRVCRTMGDPSEKSPIANCLKKPVMRLLVNWSPSPRSTLVRRQLRANSPVLGAGEPRGARRLRRRGRRGGRGH